MRRAIYPGSFDPITNGHLDIIERALCIFDELTLVVASSVRKSALLSTDERVNLARRVLRGQARVRVDRWDGLTMEYARKNRVHAVVRGLRAASDFEYEFLMAATNKRLNPKIETVFLMTGQDLYFVSASMIRELLHFDGDVSPFVPKVVADYLAKKKRKNT